MRQVALRSMRGRGGVDLCDRCGGVFLEFFDGEPSALSKEIKQHLQHTETQHRAPLGHGDPLACPDCERTMDVHPYLDEGPHIARCNRCMAVFATPEQILALSAFQFIQDTPPWYTRLVDLLRSMFAGP